MDILLIFSEVFKELKQDRNLTNQILSQGIGCSVGNISKWLNAKNMPLIPSLIKIADYFDCSIDFLLGRNDNSNIKIAENKSTFSIRTKLLCEQNNITFYRLSKLLEMNDDLIYSWLDNSYIPNAYNLCRIANYFDCSIDYLVGRTDVI